MGLFCHLHNLPSFLSSHSPLKRASAKSATISSFSLPRPSFQVIQTIKPDKTALVENIRRIRGEFGSQTRDPNSSNKF